MNQPSFSLCCTDNCKSHISTHYCELAKNRNVFVGFRSGNFPLQRQSVIDSKLAEGGREILVFKGTVHSKKKMTHVLYCKVFYESLKSYGDFIL